MPYPRVLPLLTSLLIATQILVLTGGCTKKIDKQQEYAATVNEKPITRQELTSELSRIKQRFYNAAPISEQQASQMETDVLEIMIGGELLHQASQKEGIKVPEQEVKEMLAKSKADFPDTEKFKNTYTEDDIRKNIAIVKFIAKKFADPTTISDKQAHEYYDTHPADFAKPEQVQVSQILLKVKPEAEKEAKEKAMTTLKELQKKLDQGADFSELAKKHSEDPNAATGGAMGAVLRGQTEKSFEEAAFSQEPNKTTIVETKEGYHLLKATEKTPARTIPFEEASEKIISYLKQQEVQKKIDAFIKDERQKAKIEILLTQKQQK